MRKKIIENQLKIDIRDLKAKGYKYGAKLSGKLSHGDEAIASLCIDSNKLILNYIYDNRERINQDILIDWLDCNYGNKRPYFLCPCCNRRVMTLFCIDKYFHCRICHNLVYKSQTESKFGRLILKSSKIEAKLQTDTIAVFDKPKGMHNVTYQRLIFQYNSLIMQF